MQIHSFGQVVSPMGDTNVRKLPCLLGMINAEEMNSLFSLR